MNNNKLNILLILLSILWLIPLFLSNKQLIQQLILLILLLASYFVICVFSKNENKSIVKYSCYIFVIFSAYIYIFTQYKISNNGVKYIGNFSKKYEGTRTSKNFVFSYKNFNSTKNTISINVSENIFKNKFNSDTKSIIYIYGDNAIIDVLIASSSDLEKYKYPVKCIDPNNEIGNDSYEYAKHEPYISFKNFGLKIIYKAMAVDSNTIYFTDILGNNTIKKIYQQDIHKGDTVYVSKNIKQDLDTNIMIVNKSIKSTDNLLFIYRDSIVNSQDMYEFAPEMNIYIDKYIKNYISVPVLENYIQTPQQMFDKFGLSVVYVTREINDTTCTYKDISGKQKLISFKNLYPAIVSENLNTKYNKGIEPTDKSLYKLENLIKIEQKGYGYIIENKIYSANEIENKCLQINKFIDQYKQRMRD